MSAPATVAPTPLPVNTVNPTVAAPAPAPAVTASGTFQSASLYVGDLHPEVSEGVLFEMFNKVGPVASIRVCRDAITRRSLGYAYVNFHNVQDAERSLDTMNFTDIKGRPCRIMWSQRDPSLRKSGVGNVFVKNLAPSVDNKGLFDTFSVFGNILSCKVAMDENGASKGYGYVHYETAEAAQDAIQKFNGNSIDDFEVFVGPFVRKQERAATVNWTNLYVKQFPLAWDEDKIREVFGVYGAIANVYLMKDAEGKSKGFGFVNYAEHESAENALKELASKTFPDPENEGATIELYVNRAQKRAERQRDIKTKLDALKEDRVSKFQGMNLYVKNIDDAVTDELFRETFAKFGAITSARIMRDPADNNTSKGFGFVCYTNADDAQRAVVELNNKLIRSKPITVTFHQRKEVRRAQLAATYAPRNGRFPPGGLPYMPIYGQQQQGGAGGYLPPPQQGQPRGPYGGYPPQQGGLPGQQGFDRGLPPQGMRGQLPPRGMVPNFYGIPPQALLQQQQQGVLPGQPGRYPPKQGLLPGQQQPPVGMIPNLQQLPPQQQQALLAQQRQQQQLGGRPPQQLLPGQQQQQLLMGGIPPRGIPPQQQQQRAPYGLPQQPSNGMMVNPNLRMQQLPPQQQQQLLQQQQQQQRLPQQQQRVPQQHEPLDDGALAAADPQMQKNMIGEKLYPLIHAQQPQQAGKITGMLLEMDNVELLHLIESPESLENKIQEALVVLKQHNALATTTTTAAAPVAQE